MWKTTFCRMQGWGNALIADTKLYDLWFLTMSTKGDQTCLTLLITGQVSQCEPSKCPVNVSIMLIFTQLRSVVLRERWSFHTPTQTLNPVQGHFPLLSIRALVSPSKQCFSIKCVTFCPICSTTSHEFANRKWFKNKTSRQNLPLLADVCLNTKLNWQSCKQAAVSLGWKSMFCCFFFVFFYKKQKIWLEHKILQKEITNWCSCCIM